MKRVLRSGSETALFDDATGEVVAWPKNVACANGIVRWADSRWIGLYADDGELIVQIGTKRFPMSTSRFDYSHNWDEKTTRFAVAGASDSDSVTYPAWWADSVDQWEVRGVPERDSDEDIFAWVARDLPTDARERQRVLGDWLGRDEDYPVDSLQGYVHTLNGVASYTIERKGEAPLLMVCEVRRDNDTNHIVFEILDPRMTSETAIQLIEKILLNKLFVVMGGNLHFEKRPSGAVPLLST